jgi:hypothetical protein
MKGSLRRGALMLAMLGGTVFAHAVVDHYAITAPDSIMKGDSGISFSVDPQNAANATDSTSHRVLFVVPNGVTVEGASGTGDASTGWLVAGVTNFTIRTIAVAPTGPFDLRVRDKFDGSVFGVKTIQIEPTIVSFELLPPTVPFTGTAGVGFIVQVRALGPGGVTITSYRDDVRLRAAIGDLAITAGGAGDLVAGGSFVNGVAPAVVVLYGTDPDSHQNTISAFQVDSYAGQAVPATGITSPALTINPNSYDHILLRFPGETRTPGTGSGKTGSASSQIAGASVNPVFVDLVDEWHNPINPGANPGIYPFTIQYRSFFVDVPADVVPVDTVIPILTPSNQDVVSFSLKVAGSHLIQASAGAEISQSIISVVADAGFRFKVTPDPMPPTSSAVTPFLISVEAVDIFDNPLGTYNGTAIAVADDCAGTSLGNNTIDTAPGGGNPGAQNTITFTAGRWVNRPVQVFKASNFTRLTFTDGGAGLSGASSCFDNDAGGAAQLLFTLPGQTYTAGAYPGNLNSPSPLLAGNTISATVRVTDLSWNQVGIATPQELTVYMDNAVGFIDPLVGLIMPSVGDVTVNNIRLRTSSFRPLSSAIPQVLQAQIPTPNIQGASDPIVVQPGSYSKVVLVAPTEALSPGNPDEVDGKTNTISTQSFNVAFPLSVYLTDALFNPIETPPYGGGLIWPNLQFTLQGGGDITFPTPNPALIATSLYSGAVTSRKMDVNTIIVNDTITPAKTTQVSIAVQAGTISKFVVSPNADPDVKTPEPISIQTAGASFNLAFKAYDQYDNIAKNFGGVVNLELWENGAPLGYGGTLSPSSITFLPDPVSGGVSTAAITITYAGSSMDNGADLLQIRAFINSPTREGFSAFFSVKELATWWDIVLTRVGETRQPGLGAPYKVGAPTPVLAGNSFAVTVTAVDIYGNRVNKPGVADLTMLTPNVFTNLGSFAQVSFSSGTGTEYYKVYTAGSSVLQANVTANGFNDLSTGTINAGTYEASTGRVLLLAPGESPLPGAPSPPGKDVVSISSIVANTSMAYTLLACDRFYNRDFTFTGNPFSLTSNDGAISRTDIAVNAGSGTVSGVFLNGNLPNPSTVRVSAVDQGNAAKTSYSDVPVTSGASYVVTVPSTATVGAIFTMKIDLIDPGTGLPMVGANNSISMEALTTAGGAAAVPIGVAVATLNNGTVTLSQSYGNVETIKIRVTDSFSRVTQTGNINVIPNGLLYKFTLPATSVTADDVFPVTVELYDSIQPVIIKGAVYQHSFNLFVRTEIGSLPGAGAVPINSATLVNGVANFSFSYTKAENIIIFATGTVGAFPLIEGSATKLVNPGAYVKLQIIAAGEEAVPGVPSLTGKTSAGPDSQGTKQGFSIVVNAVDKYWNIVPIDTPLSPSVRLTASDGSLAALPLQSFSVGHSLFTGVKLNSPPQVTVTASDTSSGTLFPQSVTIPINGRAYVAQLDSVSPYYSGSPILFTVRLFQYVNGSTVSAITDDFPKVTLEPVTPSLQPLSVSNLAIESPGTVGASNVVRYTNPLNLTLTYQVAEDVRIKFTDEDGWQGYSPTISFVPNGVDYVLTLPVESRVGPPDTFSMTLTPRDRVTHTTAVNFSTGVTITAVSPLGTPVPAGSLQKTTAQISGGAQTFQQGFSKAGVFYFVVSDGVETTTSTTMNFLPGPLASMTTDLPATLEAGITQEIRITTLDAFSNPIPNLNLTFALSDPSFGTLSPLSGVSSNLGISSTTFSTSGLKSGSGTFRATSGSTILSQAFRLLGPPTTSLRVGGLGVEEGKGYAIKPGDPIYMDIAVEPDTTLTSVSYSVNGGALQTSFGPFTTLPSGLVTFGPLAGITTAGIYTIEYFGETQSGLAHQETAKTSKTFFVSAETTPGEGLVNYPNPFRAGSDLTFLEFNLTVDAGVRLTIYDMMGHKVREQSYFQGEVGGSAGLNRVSWDGKNADGVVVGNGGYMAILEAANGQTLKRKIAVRK